MVFTKSPEDASPKPSTEENHTSPLMSAKMRLSELENGKPIFSRTMLEDVDRVWSSGQGKLIVEDIYGNPHEYDVKHDIDAIRQSGSFESHEEYRDYTPHIQYRSYQGLAENPRWFEPDCMDVKDIPRVPISVTLTSFFHGTHSYEDVLAKYQTVSTQWQSSDACAALKHSFAAALNGAVPIDRIVCFALGNLQRGNSSEGQHASIQTLREILLKDATEKAVPVFAQDPGYTDIDKQILASQDITVVNDPKGFLAITPNTLVLSFSPDAPVRQIIADVQWPAALVCDTIHADATDFDKEEFIEIEGRQVFVSPYTTDPCSKRVQAMVAGCKSFPFPESDYFGDMTVYLRKLKPQED